MRTTCKKVAKCNDLNIIHQDPLLQYAKHKLSKDGVKTCGLRLLVNETCIKCECCREVALFSDPDLCFACISSDRRRCPDGSTNVYYIRQKFVCFDHSFDITTRTTSKCRNSCRKSLGKIKIRDILPILHKYVIDKILLLVQTDELNQDLLNTIACKLTEACAINKALR